MIKVNKCNELTYDEVIDKFLPKIKKSLKNTSIQEREDLEQEIKIKIFEKLKVLTEIKAPGFFEFLDKK
ncbi:hypothetical protein [Bacillus sp. WMMC1349]|uniref:hypothetical protein n=1 Tax=Bacillus sp. WMMC1349 TaxID=2736254 RepID=UPI0035C9333A